MNKLPAKHVGLALGTFLAFIHLIWAIVHGLGWAGSLVKFKLSMHGIAVPVVVTPLSVGQAVLLIILAFVVGNVIGWIFSYIWNKVTAR